MRARAGPHTRPRRIEAARTREGERTQDDDRNTDPPGRRLADHARLAAAAVQGVSYALAQGLRLGVVRDVRHRGRRLADLRLSGCGPGSDRRERADAAAGAGAGGAEGGPLGAVALSATIGH